MNKEKKKEFFRVVKFTLFSVSAGVIQFVSFTLLNLIPDLDYVIKAYISLTLSVLWNFTFNRKFTFQSASNVPIAMLKTLGYYVVFAPLSIHLGDMYLVKTLLWDELIVTAVTMIINFVTEFLFQRFVVFGKSIDTNDIATKNAQKEEQQDQTPQDNN